MAASTEGKSASWLREQGLDPFDLDYIVAFIQAQAREIERLRAPQRWLSKNGFDLRAVPRSESTGYDALVEASGCGELAVCQFLYRSIGSNNNKRSSTTMFTACQLGHLHVAKWLFEVGAVEDVRDL